jgi:hypothetical protein
LVEVGSVELVLVRGGKEADDGVGGEEGALRGFEEGEGVEDRDVGEISVSVVLDLLDFNFEGVDHSLYLSVSAVSDGVVAEVQLHVVEITNIIKERYLISISLTINSFRSTIIPGTTGCHFPEANHASGPPGRSM